MAEEVAARIIDRSIVDEMENSYIDYSMSVIVGRALPDVRDGLKPVHRRILYGMHELGLTPDEPYKKSARVVGEVLGKYHPHGDAAVYEAMARMAQPFSLRYPLVDGQGNFGSIDGDPPAAMRYTEARLTPAAGALLADIDQDTVDYRSNFDDTLEEPEVLPAVLPQLLVNGASGIAVGMSTSIPPHNLGEVVDALTALIETPSLSVDQLMEMIQGPDFPTGGIVVDREALREAYRSGRGTVSLRGRVAVEDLGYGKQRLVITEIPYQTDKTRLIEKIAQAGEKDRFSDAVTAIRDESDREGMRIILELKQGADTASVVKALYRHTPLEGTYSIIQLALVDGEPRRLSLRELLLHFLEFRREVVRRRTQFRLNRASERLHVVEGLIRAVDLIDEVIALIRGSEHRKQAHRRLVEQFEFSHEQARAILQLRLHRLTGLELNDLRSEAEQLTEAIDSYQSILSDTARLDGVVRRELNDLKQTYADARRTEIRQAGDAEPVLKNLVPDEKLVATASCRGRIKYVTPETFRRNVRDGSSGWQFDDGDYLTALQRTSTQSQLLTFSSAGRVYPLRGKDLPKAYWRSAGEQLSAFEAAERDLIELLEIPDEPSAWEHFDLWFVSEQGRVKRSHLDEYLPLTSERGQRALKLKDGDRLLQVRMEKREEAGADWLLVSAQGRCIRFACEEVRATGRLSQGVLGMQLEPDDRVTAAAVVHARSGSDEEACDVTVFSRRGYGKRVEISAFPRQSRYGKGRRVMDIDETIGEVTAAAVTGSGLKRVAVAGPGAGRVIELESVPRLGRLAQGTRLLDELEAGGVQRLIPLY